MQIAERLAQMPRKYRPMYRRAVEGRSLRACINSQCLECCGWERTEVAACTDSGCPLWSVRPYSVSGSGQEGQFSGMEDPNSERTD